MTAPLFINGRFLTQPLSGMQRYAEELIGALDRLLGQDSGLKAGLAPCVLVPHGALRQPAWDHIPVRRVGILRGHAWEQTELAFAARRGLLLNLAAAAPLLHRRSILVLHDAAIFAHPHHFARAYRAVHRWLRPRIARGALRLITISEFSRRELARWCGVPEAAFTIIGDSAEHILHHPADSTVLARHGLEPGRYVLTVGNQSPNKNIALAVAAFTRAAPEGWTLAVAGGGHARIFGAAEETQEQGACYLGRVTDGELRALYEGAGLLLFPSRYEGFGVPPLEAMALGCPVLSSDASAMPEVLGDAAAYFPSDDSLAAAGRLRGLINDAGRRADLAARGRARAGQYTWAAGAERLARLLAGAAAQ